MDLTLTTPAVLFPAVSLLMLAYTNRYLALSSRVRNLYAQYKSAPEKSLLEQIAVLRYRIRLIKNMQFFGVLSLLLCMVCMFVLFASWVLLGKILFAASLVLMIFSLGLSTLEIQLSVNALDLQLKDLEELSGKSVRQPHFALERLLPYGLAKQTKGTDEIDPNAVEDLGGITVIRGGGKERSWNGIRYLQGMSAKNVGSTALSINVATVPPGAIAYAHVHDGFEVMLFIAQGRVRHTFGEGLEREVINEAGDFIYIKPGVPHEVFSIGNEPLVAFVARSTADEWDKIVDYPSRYRPEKEG